jgi:excinuclease ABC subunit C
VVRTAKDFVEKRYGIRSCKAIEPDESTHEHCLADVIRTCSAPCLKRISREEYLARFDEACEFLDGKRPEVLEELKGKMTDAAERRDFESAAKMRDTFFALKEMRKAHFVRKSPQMRREDALKGIGELAAAIGLEKPPRTIECVDISNLFGTYNVASLVVARDGLPDKRYYRHFRIKSFEGADDPRAMAEVAYRRYGPESTISASSPRADLYICDGGVTQLRAARAVFAELGISDIPTIGLAESQETIVLDDGRDDINLERDSQALMVITRLRDEAHRFAITYHKSLRDKAIRESVLDEVTGIGEAKKMKLLKKFRSVYGIARASAGEIAAAAGVNGTVAAEVLKAVSQLTRKGD